jgi:hypothetical protein
MTFVAECRFCGHVMREVPTDRLGAAQECPCCGDLFTLAEKAAPRRPQSTEARSSASAKLSSRRQAVQPAKPKIEVAAESAEQAPEVETAVISEAAAAPNTHPKPRADRRIRRQPATALFLMLAVAVVMAVVYQSGYFARKFKPEDRSAFTGSSALVHLREQGVGRRLEANTNEWVDASREAIQIGDVRVRIAGAAVEVLASDRKDPRAAPVKRFVIRLRISNAGTRRFVQYTGWNAVAAIGPKLEEEQGKSWRAVPSSGADSKKPTKISEIPPEKWVDDKLVFEAPAAGVGPLRLELPGSAIGTRENLRFQIPRAMVRVVSDAGRGKTSTN